MSARNPLLPRVAVVMVAGLVAGLFLRCSSCGEPPLRIGTYNIRRFGVEATNMTRLTSIVEETRADVLGLQEVQRVAKVKELATRLSKGGRRFEHVLSRCAGRSEMRVGFLYDAARVTLDKTREYPELDPAGGERCGGERSGLAATFVRPDGRTFQLLVVHLIAGGDAEKQAKRREQWRDIHRIAAALAKDAPVAILGDTNSTGFLDDRGGERTFILDQAKRAGLDVVTRDLKCTEYFEPEGKQLVPSLLDHVVVSPGLVSQGTVQVSAFCAELRCAPTDRRPTDFTEVSDHCPVTLDLAR